MKNTNIDLREIFNTYLNINGLTISYASRYTKIPRTTLYEWSLGHRQLHPYSISRIRQFMQGDFLVDVDVIADHMELQEELKRKEQPTEK